MKKISNILTSLVLLFLIAGLTSCEEYFPRNPSDKEPATLLERHEKNLQTVRVENDQLAYLEYGSSGDPTLILLHGIPTSSFLFRKVAEDIARRTGFRVIVPDLLGFGASDKPQRTGAYSLANHAARTFALADALHVDSFVLGVHDIGGFVGWTMLQQNADRIRGLLVTDTSIGLEGVTPAPLAIPIATGERTAREVWQRLDDPAFAESATRQFLEIGLANDSLITEELLEAYTTPIAEGASEAFVQFFEEIFTIVGDPSAIQETLAQFDRPTAIVWGSEDAFFDAQVIVPSFQMILDTPNEHVRIIEGAGHYVQEEAPDEYVKAVSNFLKKSF